tara:strand:+ start:1488 stop:2870 length:1383 start_codon:yes stop_codon:yes gene_type:complete
MAGTTDTVKAILTPGEFVIRKEAVDMIGVPTLEKLNDMPEAGGHSEIDRLIGMATLKNMTGMYGGGMVNAKQYGHGGMVNKYEDGGQAMSNLKPIPNNNPGLAKLPEDVRNKMGYMQEGGLMEMMHGGKAKKKKEMYGYQEGGQAFPEMALRRAEPTDLSPELQNYVRLALTTSNDPIYQDKKNLESEYFGGAAGSYDMVDYPERKAYKKFIQEGKGNARDDMYLRRFSNLRNELQRNFEKDLVGLDNLNFLAEKGYSVDKDKIKAPMNRLTKSRDRLNDVLLDMYISDSFKPAMQEAGIQGYQEGGAVQEDAMMQQYLQSIEAQQANPFVPFDQRPPSSGEVMSPIPAGMEQGDMMRVIRDEREVLDMQDAELLRQKAQNALTRIKLDSLVSGQGDLIEQSPDNNRFLYNDFNQPEMPPLDSIGMRDLREYFNSQLMQGRDSSDIQSGIEMDSPVFPRF